MTLRAILVDATEGFLHRSREPHTRGRLLLGHHRCLDLGGPLLTDTRLCFGVQHRLAISFLSTYIRN